MDSRPPRQQQWMADRQCDLRSMITDKAGNMSLYNQPCARSVRDQIGHTIFFTEDSLPRPTVCIFRFDAPLNRHARRARRTMSVLGSH